MSRVRLAQPSLGSFGAIGRVRLAQRSLPVLDDCKGSFLLFSGEAGGLFRQRDLWPFGYYPTGLIGCRSRTLTLEDRAALRADLGQSQSGSSSLSPRAYRAQGTTAEVAVSEILPITSVRAPRYFARRSLK